MKKTKPASHKLNRTPPKPSGQMKLILATVSQELCAEFGEGFTLSSLYRSIQFFELFPDETIVSTLSAQLSWSHFIELLPIKDPITRDFYAEMCRIEHWDVRMLRQKIGGILFQRIALSKNAREQAARRETTRERQP